MAEKWHFGITMHKLSFGSGFIGLLFAAGSALIFVLGFPTLWYFVAFALALGMGVAIVLRGVSQWRSRRNRPLSIMVGESSSPQPNSPKSDHEVQLRQAQPKLAPA